MTAKRRILVVDDELGLRELLNFEFDFLGYETVTAENADEALKLLHESAPFDLVITDIRMPGPMDGVDLMEKYWKEKPDQKVIFMTGYAVEEKLTNALKNPLSQCFRKPFSIHDLGRSVAQCFEEGALGK
jgi:DNA-binding NtrC family response regulator